MQKAPKDNNAIFVHVTDEAVMNGVRKWAKELDYSMSRYAFRAIRKQVEEDERRNNETR